MIDFMSFLGALQTHQAIAIVVMAAAVLSQLLLIIISRYYDFKEYQCVRNNNYRNFARYKKINRWFNKYLSPVVYLLNLVVFVSMLFMLP